MSSAFTVFLGVTPLAVAAGFTVRQWWVRYDSKSWRRRMERRRFWLQQLVDNAECQVAHFKRSEKPRESRTVPSRAERPNDPTWNRQLWDRELFRLRQQVEEVEEAIAKLKQDEATAVSRNRAAATTVVHGPDGDELELNHTISMKEVRNGIGNDQNGA